MPKGFSFILPLILVGTMVGCSTGVEESPEPGTVRVTLEGDPSDTTIAVVGDTIRISDQDSIDLTVFQGKVYAGGRFALLLLTLSSYRQEDAFYNLLAQDNGAYRNYRIYESRVPPDNYTKLQLGVTATVIKFRSLAPIPLQLRPGDPLLVDLPVDFHVASGQTVEIGVRLSPLKSLSRYRDLYYFDRKIWVSSIRYF